MATREPQQPWAEEISGHLRAARSRLWAIEREAQRYGPDEPAPYAAGAQRLVALLAGARVLYAEVARQHKEFLACLPDSDQNLLVRLWEHAIEPYRLWQTGKQAARLRASIGELEQAIREASRALEELDRMPLTVAARCRKLAQICRQIDRMSAELRGSGLKGAALDAAVEEAQALDARLGQLPGYFFQVEAEVLGQATKVEAIQAWQELEQVEGPVQAMVAALTSWQEQWAEIRGTLSELPQAARRTEIQLGRIPGRIEAGGLAGELARAQAGAESLRALPLPVDVDDLGGLRQRVSGAMQGLNGLAGRCAEICRQWDRLEETLTLATDTLQGVRRTMDEVAEAMPYPLEWGRYLLMRDKLAEIHADLKDSKPRPPERLGQDVGHAGDLLWSLEALSGEVDRACDQRKVFVDLVPRPELELTSDWLQEAQALHHEANVYAAGNWPARLGVARLGSDAGELYRERQRLVPANAREKVPAEEMGRRVEGLQRLMNRVGQFERRLEEVARLLAALRQAEREALERLDPACAALEQLLTALKGAFPRLDPRLARYAYLLDDLVKAGNSLRGAFADRGTGTVQDKVRRLDKWVKASVHTLGALLKELGALVERLVGELRTLVDDLQGLAPLDLTEPVQEAKRLFEADACEQGRGLGWVPKPRLEELLPAAAEAGRLLAKRGPLLLAIEALESKVAKPLRGPRQAWEAVRREALEQQEKILALKASVESGWPPLACDVSRAADWMQRAEVEEGRLQSKGRWVAETIEMLEEAGRCYKAALADMEARERETKLQHSDLVALAGRIDRWRRQLAAYEQGHRHDAAVAQAIDTRMVQIDRELGPLQQQWQRRPPAYREAKGALERVWSTVYRDVQPSGRSEGIPRREIERAV
ncbi:MAG: hypothetical protein ACP5JJ_12135 [Anaerolineae bacterium]